MAHVSGAERSRLEREYVPLLEKVTALAVTFIVVIVIAKHFGKDVTSLLKNWSTLTDTVDKQSPALSRRFSAICDRHADYIWEVGTPK